MNHSTPNQQLQAKLVGLVMQLTKSRMNCPHLWGWYAARPIPSIQRILVIVKCSHLRQRETALLFTPTPFHFGDCEYPNSFLQIWVYQKGRKSSMNASACCTFYQSKCCRLCAQYFGKVPSPSFHQPPPRLGSLDRMEGGSSVETKAV